jgi:hypothetical protein
MRIAGKVLRRERLTVYHLAPWHMPEAIVMGGHRAMGLRADDALVWKARTPPCASAN